MRKKHVQIENKNALLELLQEDRPIEKIFLAHHAFKDPKTKEIVKLAGKKGIPVEYVQRRGLSRRSKTSSTESIMGMMNVDNLYDLDTLIDEIYERNEDPYFLIFSNLKYAQNVGAIFRTAFAAGVNGVIIPVERDNLLSDETVRISMGTCLRIPIVEMNLFTAMKEIKKNGIEIMALHMDGDSIYESDLTGAKAFMLGSEDTGVSSKYMERCDKVASIPMREGLGSMNVSVSAAVVMYEKVRQDLKV